MIKVLLFGSLATQAGQREIDIEATSETQKVSDIVAEVEEKYLKRKAGIYMLAINETQVRPEEIVEDGDEVAIMPPFSGG
ncbi:MAG: MoaD/ThiS family protein [Thermodesulfobacteriota bacterium]